ncbi:MAG: XRE family transcriptional regulator [Anaerolineaceae bacterium]|nr:XRE family transcriptional regulator [Anaerolineaceae bacterium]
MITNERQYKITKRQLDRLEHAINEFDASYIIKQSGNEILAEAELRALESEREALESQLLEYEGLKSGSELVFEASSIAELPQMLIQARIARNLSQHDLAEIIGIKEQQVQRYEAEQYKGASLKRLQEVAEALKLNITEKAEIKLISEPSEGTNQNKLDWKKFPINEMYKRGWFEGFTGSLDEALHDSDSLIRDFLANVIKRPSFAFHRQRVRSGSQPDQYALLAWECRVLSLAMKISISNTFQEQSLNSVWISKFVKLSKLPDGPLQAKEMLQNAGIALIIEPHLPKTYLDGAALLCGDFPVIGMTLRHDRLDNFWFVLLHELAHIIKHLRKGKLERIFDDLDIVDTERTELEAEEFAGEALIPTNKWNLSLAPFIRSEDSVKEFAEELGINPAIVAGRIRHDANNFIILNELIGKGGVRKHFPDVIFGV